MPWCPKCGSEYRSGTERCSDCDEPLVPEKPPSVIELKPAERSHAEFLPGVRLASDGTRRTWRMRAFWLVLGALAVIHAIGPAMSLTRGGGALYGNEGFRWQLAGLGLSISHQWLYPAVIGDTVTAGIRSPFSGVALTEIGERLAYGLLSEHLQGRGLSPAAQVETSTLGGAVTRVLLWTVVIALALQWIVGALRKDEPARHGFWRSTVKSLGPMLVLGVILIAIAEIGVLGQSLMYKALPRIDQTELGVWRSSLMHLIAFPLALTPFLIVGKRLGLLAGIAATFRLIAAAWRPLLLILVLYRAGFLVVEFMDWMAYFIGRICLLPSHVMRLDAPVLQSLRNVSISGVHPAILLGWIAQVASHFASLSLDLLLCTALMSLVLREADHIDRVSPMCGIIGPQHTQCAPCRAPKVR